MKIAFTASPSPRAQHALQEMEKRYGAPSLDDAELIVALGGDGQVLKTLHAFLDRGKKVYAMRCTDSVGFLCNDYNPDNLEERLARAQSVALHPLVASCACEGGETHEAVAVNEVTFLRETAQSAKLKVSIDGIERLNPFSGDGLLVSTPAGSTAYNHSAGGPIMPLCSGTLVMTAICGFRPRRWSYAILPQNSVVEVDVIEPDRRPVRIEAGFTTVARILRARIRLDCTRAFTLLFDPDQHLGERIVREQFML